MSGLDRVLASLSGLPPPPKSRPSAFAPIRPIDRALARLSGLPAHRQASLHPALPAPQAIEPSVTFREAPDPPSLNPPPVRPASLPVVETKPALPAVVPIRKRIEADRRSFHAKLDTPMLRQSPTDTLTIRDLVSGVHITGGNGSGKTSASGAHLARAFLKAGFGGLVLCAKHDEQATWERYAHETGRSGHLIVVAEDAPWRFNFLQYELARNASLTNRIENVVSLLVNVMAQSGQKGDSSSEYWYGQAERLLGSALGILAAAQPRFTFADLNRFIFQAPTDRAVIAGETWGDHPFAKTLEAARAVYAAEGKQDDYEQLESYWLNNFLGMPEGTRGSIITTLDKMLNKLTTGTVRQLFNTDSNFFPEDSFEGAVIVLALPAAENSAYAFAQVLFKMAWQQAALRRMKTIDPETSRPLFLFADEAHLMVSPFDTTFQSLIRAGKVSTVYMTQNLNAYYQRLPGNAKETAHALLAYFQNQWFHANNDPETNSYTVKLFGMAEREMVTRSEQTTRSDQAGKAAGRRGDKTEPEDSTNISANVGDSVQTIIADAVRPEEITSLKTGSAANGYRVGAMIHRTGRVWRASQSTLLKVEFDQRAK